MTSFGENRNFENIEIENVEIQESETQPIPTEEREWEEEFLILTFSKYILRKRLKVIINLTFFIIIARKCTSSIMEGAMGRSNHIYNQNILTMWDWMETKCN